MLLGRRPKPGRQACFGMVTPPRVLQDSLLGLFFVSGHSGRAATAHRGAQQRASRLWALLPSLSREGPRFLGRGGIQSTYTGIRTACRPRDKKGSGPRRYKSPLLRLGPLHGRAPRQRSRAISTHREHLPVGSCSSFPGEHRRRRRVVERKGEVPPSSYPPGRLARIRPRGRPLAIPCWLAPGKMRSGMRGSQNGLSTRLSDCSRRGTLCGTCFLLPLYLPYGSWNRYSRSAWRGALLKAPSPPRVLHRLSQIVCRK